MNRWKLILINHLLKLTQNGWAYSRPLGYQVFVTYMFISRGTGADKVWATSFNNHGNTSSCVFVDIKLWHKIKNGIFPQENELFHHF